MIEQRKTLIGICGIALVILFTVSGLATTAVAASGSTSSIFFKVENFKHWEVKVCNDSGACSSKYTNSKGETASFSEPGDTSGTATLYHNGHECSDVGVFFPPGKVEFVWNPSTISNSKQCK